MSGANLARPEKALSLGITADEWTLRVQLAACYRIFDLLGWTEYIFNQMTEQHIQFMLSKIPMGRFGLVEEIASLVAWLASEDCSFSTGAVFDISGGRGTY